MKVVINTNNNGFNLNAEAVQEYLRLKGKECFFYEFKENSKDGFYYERVAIDKVSNIYTCFFTEDKGDIYVESYTENIEGFEFNIHDIPRHDSELVKVVESMNCNCSTDIWGIRKTKLRVVVIPDGVDYKVCRCIDDNSETIHEKHRVWG